MKMIWGIFKRDMCHATRNVIAVIVSMGLVVVPALYAWFNIAASWDPYGNTKALKVAVANNDKGYKSDLIPVRVNVGETIISTLHANDQLDWQFVKSDKAIDGVKSGEYYAAIVIPKGFSADMMTLFSPDIKHAQLKYYLNEKINPIAPHITDQGATTVVNTIDKTFAKTIAQVGLDLASSILHYSQSPQMAEYMRNLNGNLTTTADTLSGASQQVTSYSQLLGSANDIVDSTGKLLASATKAGKQAQNALKQGKSGANVTHFCRCERHLLGEHRARPGVRRVRPSSCQGEQGVRRDRQGLRHRSQPVGNVERTNLQRRIAVRHVHHKPQPHARIGGTTTGQ